LNLLCARIGIGGGCIDHKVVDPMRVNPIEVCAGLTRRPVIPSILTLLGQKQWTGDTDQIRRKWREQRRTLYQPSSLDQYMIDKHRITRAR